MRRTGLRGATRQNRRLAKDVETSNVPDVNPSLPRIRSFLRAARGNAAPESGGGLLDSVHITSRWLQVTAPSAALPHLGAAWDGVRIALLSDLHVGHICGLDYIRRVVATTNATEPDIVVLLGDHVSCVAAASEALTDLLAELRAPEGKFAVLGNHDHHVGVAGVAAMLRAAGIEVLTNSHRILERRGQALCFAGADDLQDGRPDLAAALAGVPDAVPRILLAHNPDYAAQMPAEPRVDLMLCGHTHGGQVRLPFGRAPFLSIRHRRYGEGMVRGRCCPVYITRGVGMVFLPLRLCCRPELPILTLRQR